MWVIGAYSVCAAVGEALFQVSVGYFGWVAHYLEWVGLSGGVWIIILDEWVWVGHYFEWFGLGQKHFWVGRGGWG